jgi:hypothetical protein
VPQYLAALERRAGWTPGVMFKLAGVRSGFAVHFG